MRWVIWLMGVLSLGNTAVAAQTLDELRTRWRFQQYSDVLGPLFDCRRGLPEGSAAAQEVDYMITTAMCSLSNFKFRFGCEYSRALSGMYGAYVWFEGRSVATSMLSSTCCPSPPPPPPPDETPGIRSASSLPPPPPPPRPWNQILDDAAKTISITTTLMVERTGITQQEDRIIGFKTVAIERASDSYWHWKVNLEVEYTYNFGHGPVFIGGWASGGPFESGYATWGPEQERQGRQVTGVQRVQIAIRLNQPEATSSVLRLFLGERNPPNRTIITQDFPFHHVFRLP